MDERYMGIREQAFSIKAEDLSIYLENDKQVFAAVVDIPIKGNVSTLFCSFDGTVSMYYSNGKIDISLGKNESIRKAAISFLVSAGQCLPYMNSYENHIVDGSIIQVFLFYRDGIKTKKIDANNSISREEQFLKFLIQNVLSAIRTN